LGVSLVEVMLAVLILAIILIGISTSYVSGMRVVVDQQYYQAAAQLAIEKIEELKTLGYDNINAIDEAENLSVDGQLYVRRTKTELTATPTATVPKPCKKATVAISWSLHGTDRHQANFVTYIGP